MVDVPVVDIMVPPTRRELLALRAEDKFERNVQVAVLLYQCVSLREIQNQTGMDTTTVTKLRVRIANGQEPEVEAAAHARLTAAVPVETLLVDTSLTLDELRELAHNDASGEAYFVRVRWPGGVTCPKCGSKDVARIGSRDKRRTLWACHPCKTVQFSVTAGTVMDYTKLSLHKWALAFWLVAHEPDISARSLAAKAGMTPKTAWTLCRRVRKETGAIQKPPRARAAPRKFTLYGEPIRFKALVVVAGATPRQVDGRLTKGLTPEQIVAELNPVAHATRLAAQVQVQTLKGGGKGEDFWRVHFAEMGHELVVPGKRTLRPNRNPRKDVTYSG